MVVRCMKGIFELKPSLPKDNEVWDVRVVLDYLKTFEVSSALPLKELTLKLTMLLCLTTSQRGQTIHNFDINYIQDLNDRYRISVREKLKQTKPGRRLDAMELLTFPEDKELCVVQHLREYTYPTDPLRKDHSQLLLSYVKPFRPVSRDTVSRCVKQVLQSLVINKTKYSAHSSRAASTSDVKVKGFNIAETMKSAGCSTASTFARFYDKPVSNTSVACAAGGILVPGELFWRRSHEGFSRAPAAFLMSFECRPLLSPCLEPIDYPIMKSISRLRGQNNTTLPRLSRQLRSPIPQLTLVLYC